MKRLLSIVLSLVMLCCVFTSVAISADGAEVSLLTASASLTSGDYKYTVMADGTAKIARYNGDSTSVSIPRELDGYIVTSIGTSAFENSTSLVRISFPDTIKDVASYAFYGCSNLTNVYITDMYAWCSISFIGNASSPMYYADNLYLNNVLVTDAVIPYGITSLGDYAFRGCKSLKSVSIPETVEKIGSYAFYECTNLERVTIPYDVTSVGEYAFYKCTSLSDITIPDSVTEIGKYAFEGCSALKNAYIGSVNNWCNISFGNAMSNPMFYADKLYIYNELAEIIEISDSVKKIPSYAFEGCSSLMSVTIPKSVSSIDDYAFGSCSGLIHVFFEGSSSRWNSISMGKANDALGKATHHYYSADGLVKSTTPASCENKGYTAIECPECDFNIINNYINAKGHTVVIDKAVKATQKKTGLTEGKHCSVCKKVLVKQKTTPKLGPTKITLSKSSATLYLAATTTIKATVKNAVGSTTYKSSNVKVATVNSKGKITAKKAGTAKITVSNNGVKKTFTVKVKNPYLNYKNKTIKKGQSFTLKVNGLVGKAQIRTTKMGIVSINKRKIKGLKKGLVIVELRVQYGKILRCKVKVK